MLKVLKGVAEGDAYGADVGDRLFDGTGWRTGRGGDETVVEVADGVETRRCCLEGDILFTLVYILVRDESQAMDEAIVKRTNRFRERLLIIAHYVY